MSTHTFGPVSVELDDSTGKIVGSPNGVSTLAMVKRGLSHFFGNEIASKVTAAKAKHLDDKEKNPDATPLTDDEVTALRNQFITEAHAKLMAGTVGQHTPRAAVDPMEAEVRKLGMAMVRSILSNNGIKAPKKDETVSIKGQDFTLDQLCDRQIAKNQADFEKQAKAILRDKAKRAAAAKAATKESAESVEDLGL